MAQLDIFGEKIKPVVKETEIKNLKIIARSKRGPVLPGSEIKEMLL